MDNFPRCRPRATNIAQRGPAPGQFYNHGMHRGRPPWPMAMGTFTGGRGNGNWTGPPFRPHQPFPPGINLQRAPPFQDCTAPRGPTQRHFNPNNTKRTNAPHQQQHRPIHSHMGGNSNKRKKNRKPVMEKRDLAENNAYFCDICDRGFKTNECYDIHINGHQKCKVEGCPYTAAPKLVQLHFNLQHKTGLAKKIWQFDSPEDLAKWRAERKRNFPTAANIARKLTEKAEKVARGEVLETKFFGRFRNHPSGKGRGCERGRGREKVRDIKNPSRNSFKRSHDQDAQTQLTSPKKQKNDTNSSKAGQAPQETLTGDPLSYILPNGQDGCDDESETLHSTLSETDAAVRLKVKPVAVGGLGNLMSSYGSESEEEVEDTQESRTLTPTTAKGEDVEVEVDTITIGLDQSQSTNPRRQRRRRGRKGKQKQEVISSTPKSTLLEKLLAPEIRHERNVILQCVRYIVKNNFFGLQKDTPAEESPSTKPKTLRDHADVDEEIWENGL